MWFVCTVVLTAGHSHNVLWNNISHDLDSTRISMLRYSSALRCSLQDTPGVVRNNISNDLDSTRTFMLVTVRNKCLSSIPHQPHPSLRTLQSTYRESDNAIGLVTAVPFIQVKTAVIAATSIPTPLFPPLFSISLTIYNMNSLHAVQNRSWCVILHHPCQTNLLK